MLCLKPLELSIRIFWVAKTACPDTVVLAKFRPNDGHWEDPETFLWAADPGKYALATKPSVGVSFHLSITPAWSSVAKKLPPFITATRESGSPSLATNSSSPQNPEPCLKILGPRRPPELFRVFRSTRSQNLNCPIDWTGGVSWVRASPGCCRQQ